MRSVSLYVLSILILTSLAVGATAQVQAVSAAEAQAWLRYTVPLPKTVSISNKITLAPTSIAITVPASSSILVGQARKELLEALRLPQDYTNPASPACTITLVLGGTESDPLVALKNSDQASKITVEAGNTGIRLIALEPAGLYYAVKTLTQLVEPYATGTSATIPLLEMTDWPDMADRGVWGNDHYNWLRWMGDRKMNIGEQISARSVSSDGVGHSSLKPGREPMVTEGPYYNVQPVPVTLHLEQVYASGLFTYLPQTVGVGGQYGCINYGQGRFTTVLADWICDLASLPYVDGVDVWMAENLHGKGGCTCSLCSPWDRNVLEAKVIVDAWNMAKQRLGRDIKLWILTSEETYNSNAAVFASLPSDVRVWYYHSLYTYTSGRTSIIANEVANLAASGRYAGVCPSLAYISDWMPFQSAEFVNYRMNEFVSKGLKGLLGYAIPPPMVNWSGYNVEAAAEWSWNVSGRSLHEFATSYAVRKGYTDPELFAQWADTTGKLEFDLYGSEWPACEGKFWPGYVAALLQSGGLPGLGTAYAGARGPWGEYKTAQQLDDGVFLAAKAMALAKQMGNNEYWYESLYIDGLINSLRALYKLKGLVVGGTVSSANRETARYYFGVYVNSLRQSIAAVQNWNLVINNESASVSSIVEKMQQAIDGDGGSNPGMLHVAADVGCTPNLAYNATPATTIADAKRMGPGTLVKLYGDMLTGSYGTTKFIQERDRSAGIRVNTSTSLTSSAPASVYGIVVNTNGELVVNAELAQSAGSAETVSPVAVNTRNIGGGTLGTQPGVKERRNGSIVSAVGLNNLGLYVRIAGKATYVGADYFYVDDGSACDDDTGNHGVRVQCASSTFAKPQVGAFVRVDGIVSTYYERSNNWRAIYMPAAANCVTLAPPREIIIDEDGAAFTGSWTYTTATSGAWENDYKYTSTATSETATARWTPSFDEAGSFDVYVMYCQGADRPTDAAYTVNYDGGSQTYHVDQTTSGGTWVLLGRHPFVPGTSGYVQLTNAGPTAGKTVVGDAVRFVYAGEILSTPPHINSQPASKTACSGGSTTFSVSAWGSSPMTYQWRTGTTNLANGGRIAGATTETLTISNLQASDAATDYNCVVTNAYGSDTSTNASLTVSTVPTAPAAVSATVGTDNITWRWSASPGAASYRLWNAASGGTQIGGTITGTSFTESGFDITTTYTRYVEAVNSCGTSTRTALTATTAARWYLENADFESGFTSGVGNKWTLGSGSGTFSQDTGVKYQGTSSQKMHDEIGGDSFTAWVYQKVNVQANHSYTLSAWHRRAVTSGAVIELGVNYTGGTTVDTDSDCVGSANTWTQKTYSFTAGATGKVTVMFRMGSNAGDTNAWIDLIYLRPQAPTSTGGSTTISAGGSATITASGGFAGTSGELHWYTGAKGTGTHVGTGTSLVVSPTATTTYYPRWETGSVCPSDDGTAVTVTVTP